MKLIALSAKHTPNPVVSIKTPASAGPMMRVALFKLELSAMALPSSERPTSCTISAWRLGLLKTRTVPRTTAIASMIQTVARWVKTTTASNAAHSAIAI